VAREAFAVIREGMKGKAGIGKVALYGREYLVKVQPREQGLVMYTLRHANEIRSMDAIDELADMPATVKPDEVKLAKQVMGTFEGEVDFESYRDDYQVGLREIIDAKIEGREIGRADIRQHVHLHAVDDGEEIRTLEPELADRLRQSAQARRRRSAVERVDVAAPLLQLGEPQPALAGIVRDIVDRAAEGVDLEHGVALLSRQDAHRHVERAARRARGRVVACRFWLGHRAHAPWCSGDAAARRPSRRRRPLTTPRIPTPAKPSDL